MIVLISGISGKTEPLGRVVCERLVCPNLRCGCQQVNGVKNVRTKGDSLSFWDRVSLLPLGVYPIKE